MTTVNYAIDKSILPVKMNNMPVIGVRSLMVHAKIDYVNKVIKVVRKPFNNGSLLEIELDLIKLIEEFKQGYNEETLIMFAQHYIYSNCAVPIAVPLTEEFHSIRAPEEPVYLIYLDDTDTYHLVHGNDIQNPYMHDWYREVERLRYVRPPEPTYLYDEVFISEVVAQSKSIKIKYSKPKSAKTLIERYEYKQLNSLKREFSKYSQKEAGAVLRKIKNGTLVPDKANLFQFADGGEFAFGILSIILDNEKRSYLLKKNTLDKYQAALSKKSFTDRVELIRITQL